MKTITIILIALIISGAALSFIYNFKNNKGELVPGDYQSPTISPEQAEQYRTEEQQLFKELNYTGVKHYTIPIN